VISPFVDKQHGTERAVAELLERLAHTHGVQIDLYSQRIADLQAISSIESSTAVSCKTAIRWHKVHSIPGPHLLQFLWWYFANRVRRRLDGKRVAEPADLLYSAGINATDAEAVTVHIVFHAHYEKVREQLRLLRNSPLQWPVLIHRRLYYWLLRRLERRVYRDERVALFAVSKHVANQLQRYFDRSDVLVARHGVDTSQFNSVARLGRRGSSRARFEIAQSEFVFLLIGNDWKNKGLDALLRAVAECQDLPVRLLVVGKDSREPYLEHCKKLSLENRVSFLEPSADVMQFYAAADAYVGPSLEDAYGLPILEAMACGLPVVVSTAAGASEIIIDGENGLQLQDPSEASTLASVMRRICTSPDFAESLGKAAQKTAAGESWDAHAARMCAHFEEVIARKKQRVMQK